MKVKQLGNAGAFNVNETNSSFLIELTSNTYLLFDCGFNVMSKLLELHNDESDPFILENLNHVFISHTHDDHIGNLSTLIFYRYFMLGKSTKVITGLSREQILPFLPARTELKAGQVVEANMWTLDHKRYSVEESIFMYAFPVYHPGSDTYGLTVTYDSQHSLMITGDTKAYEPIEERYNKLKSTRESVKIFHDFSHWDNPSRNVHACLSDMKSEYSQDFVDSLTLYHTNDPFNREWQEI